MLNSLSPSHELKKSIGAYSTVTFKFISLLHDKEKKLSLYL